MIARRPGFTLPEDHPRWTLREVGLALSEAVLFVIGATAVLVVALV